MIRKSKYESGNILVSSLLVLLAMNLLAITLVQTSMREYKVADFKTIDSTTFYLAESCIDDSFAWFRTFDKAPTTLPHTITKDTISHLYTGTESSEITNRLDKYSYDCTITSLTVKSVEASETGVGENIGSGDSYGLSGDLRPKYYYEIDSDGNGPADTHKKLIAIVAVEY